MRFERSLPALKKLHLTVFALSLLVIVTIAPAAHAQVFGGGAQGGQPLYCASDDGGRKYCPADTRGGVQITQQVSGSQCIQGQTWGWDGSGVWVDRGCRANFLVATGYTSGPGNSGQTLYCASDDGGRKYCPANTRGGVQMTQQVSGSQCIQGQTWGWDNNGVWVDRGCRANFTVNSGGFWGGGGGGGGNSGQTVYCASDDGRRNYCNAGNTRGGVQMVNQRSGSSCVQGRTWGYDRSRIWVDKGCRADFVVGNNNGWQPGFGGGNGGNTVSLTCSSDDGRRHTCGYPGGFSPRNVVLTNQRSGSACTYGQSWAWNEKGVWVDKGCRADFQATR